MAKQACCVKCIIIEIGGKLPQKELDEETMEHSTLEGSPLRYRPFVPKYSNFDVFSRFICSNISAVRSISAKTP
jgi:hypothetical protein